MPGTRFRKANLERERYCRRERLGRILTPLAMRPMLVKKEAKGWLRESEGCGELVRSQCGAGAAESVGGQSPASVERCCIAVR
jgi:hypothetical protein